ncbi:MAG TPA: hypothetical protein VD902_08690, partial [Symbiobacteriaceae bacterium]|nr:hypothetical protein [Symbiobacteriaceae bacterium]
MALLRAAAFLTGIGAAYGLSRMTARVDRPGRWSLWLAVAGNVLAFLWMTLEITLAFDGAHNGRVAGNEGLTVAAGWALYGLALALWERRRPHLYLRYGARAAVGAGVMFMVLGALMANARWALPG